MIFLIFGQVSPISFAHTQHLKYQSENIEEKFWMEGKLKHDNRIWQHQ